MIVPWLSARTSNVFVSHPGSETPQQPSAEVNGQVVHESVEVPTHSLWRAHKLASSITQHTSSSENTMVWTCLGAFLVSFGVAVRSPIVVIIGIGVFFLVKQQ